MNTFVKIGLGVAIAVIFPLMVGLGIEAFYASPKDPYEQCLSVMPKCEEGQKCLQEPKQDPTYKKCFDEQDAINQAHNRNVFVITTVIGFVTIAGGALFLSEAMGPIAPGIVFGGLFTIMYGTGRGAAAVDKRWLFLELLVVLAGLILVTRRYLSITAKAKK
ncbi:MAG: hypothetical protein A2126_03780 [Candidatus Woykebacteria bacterium GWB1_45_5]|uniref:Uncharacterized protein n=2 Tax=Candidatus Woykeibacteriota TaxID=1817899 RepID=A0A1G1W4T3_9BACT|nr:MAG: hypothetical protein A2113_02265 [Candidatus Woykebacteria bacterium GWA1_44_8]OGY23605.1 MAG: hypothetical protein A2126_03780 [Candidatus Woykebacteria bacterium GWB1_45_5]